MASDKPTDDTAIGNTTQSDIADASTEAGIADENAAYDRAMRDEDSEPTKTQA